MPRTRTFIAIDLDPGTRARTVRLQEDLAETGPTVKWVEPENLHLTMLFLGEVDNRELLDVCRAVRAVTDRTPPFAMRVAGVGCFPNARRPRTVWAGIEDGADI